MHENNLISILLELKNDLLNIEGIEFTKEWVSTQVEPQQIPQELPIKVKRYFSEVDRFQIEWIHNDLKEIPNAIGKINLLPVQTVFSDWEDVVWLKGTPMEATMKDFRVLDYFVNEACVGFFENGQADSLYFYDFHEPPQKLFLNFEGYVQMLRASYGFFYWQLVILFILKGKAYTEVTNFKNYMPRIFPNFSFHNFLKLYEKVRIESG